METWQRLSFVLICCVITLVVMQKRQANAEQVAAYKKYICIVNFILCLVFMIRDDIVSLYALFGAIIGCFSLLLWNHWLYVEMFDDEKATFRIRYRSFEMIGLLAAVTIFSLLFLEVLGLRV